MGYRGSCMVLVLVIFCSTTFGFDDVIENKILLGGKLRSIKQRIELLQSDNLYNQFDSRLEDLESRSDLLHVEYETIDEILTDVQLLEQELNVFVTYPTPIGDNNSFNFSIFDNFPNTKAYVVNASVNFVFELLGDNRSVSVSELLSTLYFLQINDVSTNDKDNFLVQLFILLNAQTQTNPPQYVSHGTDHSVRVMAWSFKLQDLEDVNNGMTNNYGCVNNQTKLLLGLIGILHDIGYADLDQHKVPKWLHSTASGKLTDLLLHNRTQNKGAQILIGCTTKGDIVNDMLSAISTHNFDDGFCIWNTGNPLYAKQCTFTPSGNPNDPNSATTPLLNANVTYVRQYTKGFTLETPLTFSIRVADNLDAVRTRLTPVQNNPNLMKFFLWLYTSQEVRQGVIDNAYKKISDDELNKIYTTARTLAAQSFGLSNATGTLKLIIDKSNEQSFLHFYSNWIIQNSVLDTSEWELVVQLFNDSTVPKELEFSNHVGPGLYQINRFASSAYSCYADADASFLDLLRITVLLPIAQVDDSVFLPLKSFTKKPVYDNNGLAHYSNGDNENICDPYCSSLTTLVTLSPESCHSNSGEAVSGCDYKEFSQIAPYTDLTYPADTPETSSTSTTGSSEVEKPNNGSKEGLIIGLAVGFVVVAAVAIGFVIYRKKNQKRYEYQPL